MTNVARRVLWFAGVPLAALAGGYLGFFPVFTMGLVVPLYLVGPLSIVTGALLATLFAGWLGNLASRGGSRSRLLAALAVSVVGAVLGLVASALVGRALYAFAPFGALWPANAAWAVCALVFAAVTSTAVWRLRRTSPAGGGSLGVAGVLALGLSLAWAVMLSLDEGMAYQLGLVRAGFGPVIPVGAVLWVSLSMAAAGAATLALQRLRGTGRPWGGALARDAALTLLLAGLAPALVVGVVGMGCELTYCGA